jgi:hypothetical protein
MKSQKTHSFITTTCFFVLLLLGFDSVTFAQKNKKDEPEIPKAELKELKKRKKDMDPLVFKDIFEERNKLKGEFGNLERQVKNVGGILANKDKEIDELKRVLDSLRQNAAKVSANNTVDPVYGGGNSSSGGGTTANEDYTQGLVFKVQVGDVSEAKLNGEIFQNTEEKYAVEKDEDGKLKYTLGHFRDYVEANDFKTNLRKIGVKVAWIVAYKNGKRQNMKDARK